MPYDIRDDVKFGPLERIDVSALGAACQEKWFKFHWHKHDREDELFYVVEGTLFVDLEDRTIELAPAQAFMVPRGVVHRTRAPHRTVMLMIEGRGVVATGD